MWLGGVGEMDGSACSKEQDKGKHHQAKARERGTATWLYQALLGKAAGAARGALTRANARFEPGLLQLDRRYQVSSTDCS